MAGRPQALSSIRPPLQLMDPTGTPLPEAEIKEYESRELTKFLDGVLNEFYARGRETDFFGLQSPPRQDLEAKTRQGLLEGIAVLLEEHSHYSGSVYQLMDNDWGKTEIESGRCFAAGVAAHVAQLNLPQGTAAYAAYVAQQYANFLIAESIPQLRKVPGAHRPPT